MENKLENAIQSVKENRGLDTNKRHILNYDNELQVNGITMGSRATYLMCIKPLLTYAEQKKFEDLTKEEMADFFERVKNRKFIDKKKDRRKETKLSDSSMNLCKNAIKKFFRFVYGFDEGYPDCVKWVKTKNGNGNGKRNFRDSLLTQQEIFQMIQSADNSRDRAMVVCLWESGARISEFLSMKLKDVEFDQHGAIIKLPTSKTRPRKVRLIYGVTYLSQWFSWM